MPKKKNAVEGAQVVTVHDVDTTISHFVEGLRNDLRTLYGLGKASGFNEGVLAERQRMSDLFTKGAVTVGELSPSMKTTVPKKSGAVPAAPVSGDEQPAKKKRINPWDKYTPEQKAERLKNLAEARKKSAEVRKGTDKSVETTAYVVSQPGGVAPIVAVVPAVTSTIEAPAEPVAV